MANVQEVLAGRYELPEVLGRGGMGVVYRATDQVLGRSVAIKTLPVDRAEDPSSVARFEREALAAAGLNHPNVVAVYDSGQADGTRFIVMECVAGKNLAQLGRERGPLPAEEAAEIGSQTAGAIAAAHRAGTRRTPIHQQTNLRPSAPRPSHHRRRTRRHRGPTTNRDRLRRQTAPIDQPHAVRPGFDRAGGTGSCSVVSGALDEQLEQPSKLASLAR
jgi:serine/threonine protein kinase